MKTEDVLRVEGAIAKQLAAALKKKKVAALLDVLAKLIDPKRPPKWLAFNAGGFLDTVVHLAAPAFFAEGADEDEFWSEPDRAQVVYAKRGKCDRVDTDGETSTVNVESLAEVTAYDLGGFLLHNITWIDTPPKLADGDKLFATAGDAYQGDLAPYSMHAAETVAASGGLSGTGFHGGARRTGAFAAQPNRKQPRASWTSKESNGTEYGVSPTIVDDVIYSGDDSRSASASATSKSGKVLWDVKLSKTQSWPVGEAWVDRGVVYQATNQGVYALDAKTGKQKWLSRVSYPAGTPIVVGEQLFVGGGEGVIGLAIATGRAQWKFAVKRDSTKVGVRSGLAYDAGVIYFIAESKLFAVEIATAKKLWAVAAYSGRATPSLDDDSVYAWTEGGVTAFDRKTGKQRWASKADDVTSDCSIAVGSDRVVARLDGKLVALAKKTGKKLWSLGGKKPYSIGSASPIIAGDVALCILVEDNADTDCTLYAADLATGKQLWMQGSVGKDKSSPSWYCTPAVLADGTVIAQAYGLFALR